MSHATVVMPEVIEPVIVTLKGGAGSGHRGHAGRPGKRGGSSPGVGAGYVGKHGEFVNTSWAQSSGLPMGHMDSVESKPGQSSRKLDERMVSHLEGVRGAGYDGKVDIKERLRNEWAGEQSLAMNDDAIKRISKDTGVPEEGVKSIYNDWITMNTVSADSLSVQRAASEEFGRPLSPWQHGLENNLMSDTYELYGKTHVKGGRHHVKRTTPHHTIEDQRKVLRSMYDGTQEKLKNVGYAPDDTVRLFRGVRTNDPLPSKGSVVEYRGNVLQAWTLNKNVGDHFGNYKKWQEYGGGKYTHSHGYTLAVDVPARSILSLPGTGLGDVFINEVVLIGNPGDGYATRVVSTYE